MSSSSAHGLQWSRRLARWPYGSFSLRPPPNRTCKFPSIRLSSGRILRRSALGISPTLLPTAPVRLPPFATWPAFPVSDYYGGSVALGLAPGRRSRVFLASYVRAWDRSSVRSYPRTHRSVPHHTGLPRTSPKSSTCDDIALSQPSDGAACVPTGTGLQAIQP